MEDEELTRLQTAVTKTRELRRHYNNLLVGVVEGNKTEYNIGDLARLLGELECLYMHLLEWISSGDSALLCCLKHATCSLILAGEMDEPNLDPIYEILVLISNGVVQSCQSCARETESELAESE